MPSLAGHRPMPSAASRRRSLAIVAVALLCPALLPVAAAAPGHEPICPKPHAYIPNQWVLADGHVHYHGCWDFATDDPWDEPYWDGEDWFSGTGCSSGIFLIPVGYAGIIYYSCPEPNSYTSRAFVVPEANAEGARVRGYVAQGVPDFDVIAVGLDACVSLTGGEADPCAGSGDLWNAKVAVHRRNWGYIYDPFWGVWRDGPSSLVLMFDQDRVSDEPNQDPGEGFTVSVDGTESVDLVPNRFTLTNDGAVAAQASYEPNGGTPCATPRVRTSTNLDTPCPRPNIQGEG